MFEGRLVQNILRQLCGILQVDLTYLRITNSYLKLNTFGLEFLSKIEEFSRVCFWRGEVGRARSPDAKMTPQGLFVI